MTHQPLPVAGYSAQSSTTVAIVNQHKKMEEHVLQQLDRLADAAADTGEFDLRWLSVARTHIEQGFMALNRAVFRPHRIKS